MNYLLVSISFLNFTLVMKWNYLTNSLSSTSERVHLLFWLTEKLSKDAKKKWPTWPFLGLLTIKKGQKSCTCGFPLFDWLRSLKQQKTECKKKRACGCLLLIDRKEFVNQQKHVQKVVYGFLIRGIITPWLAKNLENQQKDVKKLHVWLFVLSIGWDIGEIDRKAS